MAMHIGQAAFETIVVVAESFMIEAEEVQDGGVEIINAGDIDGSFPAEFIGLAVVFRAVLHTSSSEDAGEAAGIVIATGRAFLEGGHAAELGAENEECISEQTSLLEVHKQRGGRLI